MTNEVEALNKWRMEQFHISNQPDASSDTEFVCLSPSKYEKTDIDPKLVFLTDSETDDNCSVSLNRKIFDATGVSHKHQLHSPNTMKETSGTSRLLRKRKKANVVYTRVSDSSESDEIVEAPKRKRVLKKSIQTLPKELPLKPLSAVKKTAVVVPITKSKPLDDVIVNDFKPEVSKRPPVTPVKGSTNLELLDELLNSPVPKTPKSVDKKLGKNDQINQIPISPTLSKNEDNNVQENDEITSITNRSKRPRIIEEKVSGKGEIDQSQVSNGADSQVTKLTIDDPPSDSDVSLFEISFSQDASAHSRNLSSDKFMHNPPPSPVDPTGDLTIGDHLDSSTHDFLPVNPTENGFTSDSSMDAIPRKRSSKGKQPANKRKKVVAKRSRPLSDEDTPAGTTVSTDVQSVTAVSTDVQRVTAVSTDVQRVTAVSTDVQRVTAVSTDVPLVTAVSTDVQRVTVVGNVTDRETIDLTGTHTLPGNKTGESNNDNERHVPLVSTSAGSTTTSEECVNKAIVKPTPVVVIADDDDDDDIVMLSTNERNQQELDDLEFARRLQAQFDQETTAPRNPVQSHATSSRPLPLPDTPLTGTSERLLQALGGTPAVTQFLASPSARQQGIVPAELDSLEQRLELLQQLALQQEYLDDATISEILGVAPDAIPETRPRGGPGRGPRPSSRRGAFDRRSETARSRGGALHRVMQGAFGMDNPDEMSYESLLELSDRIGDVRRAGLSAESIERLPSRDYSSDDAGQVTTTCHICMSDFVDRERLRTLNCFHEYHSACIDQWLQVSTSCPVCRVHVNVN